MKKKSLLVENVPDGRKNLCLCKTSFMKEKSWLVNKFFAYGKIIALCFLKIKSSTKTNANVEVIKISISKLGAKS